MSITATQLLARVEKLGRKRPEQTAKCKYVKKTGAPCCIVGTALAKEGVNMARFADDVDLNKETSVADLFKVHADEMGLVKDSDAALVRLQRIQSLQDQGLAWGDAVVQF